MTDPTRFLTPATDQRVAISSVDPQNYRATAITRQRTLIVIDTRYHVGAVHVTPAVGDQWIVRRFGENWVLDSQLPANTTELLTVADNPVPGMTQVGSTNPSGQGPLHLNGSEISANAPMSIDGILTLGTTMLRGGASGVEMSGPALESIGPVEQSTDGGDTWTPVGTGTGGGPVTIPDVTGLSDALDAKVDENAPITAATHTKITYDSKGLVLSGTDAQIADIINLQTTLDSKANAGAEGLADPFTTKGDILTRTATATTRKGVGANGTLLLADDTQVDGLEWGPLVAALIPGLDVTKIISGVFGTGFIPGLDASKIISGLFGGSLIPGLDASKIISGLLGLGQIPSLPASQVTSGTFGTGLIPNLDATKITTGLMNLLRIPTMDVPHIPALDATQITSGSFGSAQIPSLDAAKITSGVLGLLRIPNLPAGQVTSGTFLTSLIPSLDASKITSGILDLLHIPSLPAGQITSGQFPQSMLNITSIAASLVTGILGLGTIPGLDATKITSGSFPQTMISGLDSALAAADQVLTDTIVQAMGGTGSGYTYSDVEDALQNIPGFNIVSQLIDSVIPDLDAAKITTGTLLGSLIPGLPASRITSGIFGTGLIPSLPASQITTGTFGTGLIPNLDASKIISGLLDALRIPALDATKITSGTFSLGQIPGLDLTRIPSLPASQITSGIFGTGLIPSLPASQITSGIFGTGLIPNLDAGKIVSGLLNALRIPALDATQVTTGTFSLSQIPGLDLTRIPSLPASQITSGIFGTGLIPSLPASQITSGIFGTGLIPSLDAGKITSGIMDLLRLPGMPASQITSGTFPQTMISNLTSNLASIFTTITSPTAASLLQNVPVSSIGQTNPELLANPNYDSLGSVAGGSTNWTWDSTASHTAGSTGSAKVVANGTTQQLLSDPPIPVSPSQVLSVSHWLQWSGVTASAGLAFRISIAAYLGTGISNTVDIATVSNPAVTGAWQQLSGTYTVPASGVDNIRLQLTVSSLVTAGTVWWDDGSVKKTQLLNENWTSGLPGDLNNLFTGVNARALITDVTSLMSAIGLGDPSLTAIVNRLSNLGSTGGFDASKLGNIVNIPQLLAASVAGIGGGANIGASLQQTWDQVSGLGTNNGSLAGILTRLAKIGTGGLFDSSALTNLLNHPVLPATTIPALDGSVIQSGTVPIGQMPLSQLNRTTLTDLGNTLDQITNAFVGAGSQFLGTNPTQARQSMDSIYGQFLDLTQKMQDIRSSSTATDVSGTSVTVNFSQLPDGSLPTSFTVTYSGAGTSLIGIANGAAGWRTQNNNGNRTALIIYNQAPTATDFQIVRGTLSGAPPSDNGGSKPRIAAIGRVDNPNNPQNYVWARGYNNGFLTYQGDIGCTVNGVDTVWISNIPLTWSMDINFVIGVGGNPRRYQVFSGSTLVYDYTESGTTSQLGAAYRYWGCKSELKTDSGKAIAPPSIVGTSVSDNQPPSVVGSTFRAYRASTGGVTFSGTNVVPTSPPFFDTLAYKSSDFIWDGANLTLGVEGTYLVNIRYQTPNIPGGAKADVALALNGGLARRMGGGFADSSIGANSGSGIFGMTLVYGHVNDVLTPAYIVTSNTSATGETTGTCTYFEVALVNRSTA